MRIQDRAEDIAAAIAAMPWEGAVTPEMTAEIIALFQPGEYAVFDLLDSKPGGIYVNGSTQYRSERCGEWHIKLRQVRNGDNNLFDQLKG